jgi:pimeloyl-ACP methyl ester carboxylesterase
MSPRFEPRFEPVLGRYLHLDLLGKPHRLYVEEAGQGIPLFLLTGEYDYSCTAEGTLDVAKRTGAAATIMKGLGHFPMSEDPEKFVSYLLPVLEKIKTL